MLSELLYLIHQWRQRADEASARAHAEGPTTFEGKAAAAKALAVRTCITELFAVINDVSREHNPGVDL